MKRALILAALIIAAVTVSVSAQGKPLVAMVTDTNGLGDGSFNDGVYAGLQKAEKEGLCTVKVVESHAMTDYVPNLSGLAEDGAKLVFGVGALMIEQIQEAAKGHPDTYFAGIDHYYGGDIPQNLVGISYREQEAGYLVGIVAGYMTKKYYRNSPMLNSKNVIGAVLGMDIPPVERYLAGYIAGARSVDPTVEVRYITTGTFADRAKGKEATIALIDQGADIVMQIAGLTGMGVLDAARERHIFAIGADVDQSPLAPDYVLTSALKGTTISAYDTIKALSDGTLKGGQNVVYGIKEDAIGIAPFHKFDRIVPAEVKNALKRAEKGMIDGSITVPTTLAELGISK